MQYFALLISKERERTPDEGAAEMAAYESIPPQGRIGDPRW